LTGWDTLDYIALSPRYVSNTHLELAMDIDATLEEC